MRQADERQLINRILDGHTEDYGYFLERYGHEVFALVARMVGQQQDAEEITQDAFIKAFNRLSSFNGNSSFCTWLCRIAYNSAYTFLKKRKEMLSIDEEEPLLNLISNEMVDEALSDEREHRILLLEQAIGELSPIDKTLIALFYYENRSLKEIAYIMGEKEYALDNAINKLSTRLSRIRKKLYVRIKQLENE